MSRKPFLGVLIGLPIFAACAGGPAPAQAPRGAPAALMTSTLEPSAPKIAFVDVRQAVRSCGKLAEVREALRSVEAGRKPGVSDEELLKKNAALERVIQSETVGLFPAVREIVERLARRRGLDAVFKWDPVKLDGRDVEMDAYEIDVCRVLYRSQALDLTAEVTRLLDERLAGEK